MDIDAIVKYVEDVSYSKFERGKPMHGTKVHAGYVTKHVFSKFGAQTLDDWCTILSRVCGMERGYAERLLRVELRRENWHWVEG